MESLLSGTRFEILFFYFIISFPFSHPSPLFSLAFTGAFAKLRKANGSFMSVRLFARNNSAPTGRIFMKFGFEYCSETCRKNKVLLKCEKNNSYFTLTLMYICDIELFSS
jgi:hypothetical protein